MKLYLIRHGESEANVKGLHSTPETKLTKEGIKQAKVIAKRLKNFQIDFIYSSPLLRAKQTSQEISKTLKLPIEFWEEISEVKTPSINWGKPENDTNAVTIEKEIQKHYSKGNWKHSDEETFNEIKERAENVLKHLLKKHEDQNVLCVSHTSFIKMVALSAVLGKELTPEVYRDFRDHSRIHNSGVSIVEFTKKYGWVLDTWNDKSHL